MQRLTEKVSQCQEKHKLLAEENERLREAIDHSSYESYDALKLQALNAVEAKCSIVGCAWKLRMIKFFKLIQVILRVKPSFWCPSGSCSLTFDFCSHLTLALR